MARREFLMLAKPFDPDKHQIGGWYYSEKLDGTRCFWDGGISRGTPTVRVPWAGIVDPSSGQLKDRIKPEATGLWSRYGNPIIAPDWFLNTLPACPLDGELWAGRGNYQKCRSIVSKHNPEGQGEEWYDIQYGVFGTPDYRSIMADGEINNPNQKTEIRYGRFDKWSKEYSAIPQWKCLSSDKGGVKFATEIANLCEWLDTASDTCFLIPQTKLPKDQEKAVALVNKKMREILLANGEGLFLRDPDSYWLPKRVETSLKVKGALDDEGTVVGFTSGRLTGKGSKLLGMIGALVLDYKGQRLELASMTDEERQFAEPMMSQYASDFPGKQMPDNFEGKFFKKGDVVTFTFPNFSDKGIPLQARLLRKR